MYITCSRNCRLLVKRFAKYLSNFLPDIKYIPRGKTNLSKLYERSKYLGYRYFIICENNNMENQISLVIYKLKEDQYFIDKKYILEILDLRHVVSFTKIKKNNLNILDKQNLFYFIDKKYKSELLDCSLSVVMLENKKDDLKTFEFVLNKDYLGTKFRLLDVINID